jgi:hypothetical protein
MSTRLFWLRAFGDRASIPWTEFITAFLKDYQLDKAKEFPAVSKFETILMHFSTSSDDSDHSTSVDSSMNDTAGGVMNGSESESGGAREIATAEETATPAANTDFSQSGARVVTVDMINAFVPPGTGLFQHFQRECDPGTPIVWVGSMGVDASQQGAGNIVDREDGALTGGNARVIQSLLGERIIQVIA